MSNNQQVSDQDDVVIDELESDTTNDEVVDKDEHDTETSEKEEEKKETDQEREEREITEHKERVYQGMIKSALTKVATGEQSIDEIKDLKLREIVRERLAGLSVKKEVIPQEDKIVEKLKLELKLDGLVEQLEPEFQKEARQEFYEQISLGKTTEQAFSRVKKVYDLFTPTERARIEQEHGQRVHKVGGLMVEPELTDEDLKAIEAAQATGLSLTKETYLKHKKAGLLNF
jgi:hypothetical protein